jgi:hypothetical protein
MSGHKTRNPLEIIRHYIDFYTDALKQRAQAGYGAERLAQLEGKISLLQTLETDMEIEYFPLGDKATLGELRKGAVFATENGVYAVKSEYHNDGPIDPVADSEGVNLQCQCILLSSGEFADFKQGNATVVYEMIAPNTERGEAQG